MRARHCCRCCRHADYLPAATLMLIAYYAFAAAFDAMPPAFSSDIFATLIDAAADYFIRFRWLRH